MGIYDLRDEYAGSPVFRFDQSRLDEDAEGLPELPAPGDAAWCVATEFDEEAWDEVWKLFRETVDTTGITTLMLGYWGAEYDSDYTYPVPLLVEAAASFPALRHLFIGEITAEESEISWIDHGDITPVFEAFPNLERLDVRGAEHLTMQPVAHAGLRTLRFESGGLPAAVVRAVGASDLPNLEHLDLWLGTASYGGDATPADLAPILSGERLPALRHLGLEDAEIQDDVAEAVAGAPVVARLESLSLAMGILTDRGAEALLAGQPLTHLQKLELRHHFLSEPMMERVRAALPDVTVGLDDRQKPDGEWFFIEVSE
ncbi:STM4015 family protein [Actinomadura sp. WAC 06369]|uniref:STM4015 family protein n=1 Tax=Actinomadura sp. WAC 06369 TaxID=2203193 RepID=UPI000F7877EB|nr:STM4015 family protein [Actinomadura sp. WAC 06369]RSN61623.1 cytoplasmic protein [Actinomadura sp. WAC 06369]